MDEQTQKERSQFYEFFKEKTIIRGGERDTSLIVLITYGRVGNKNEYYFTQRGDSMLFCRDTLQYFDTVIKNNINSFIRMQIRKLDSLKINSVNSSMRRQGIDLKVYFKDASIRIYVKNPIVAKNGPLKHYFMSAKRIDNNWYSVDE